MINSTQFVAGRSGELGVLGQYLDGELHLVGDALPKGLITRPQFQVRNPVIQSVTVLVMHAFEFGQRAAKMFRHNISVFEYFSSAGQVQSHVSGRVQVTIGVDRTSSSAFPSTGFTAEFLRFVVAGVLPIKGAHQASFFHRAAELALKSWGGFLVHTGQLLDSPAAVKGVI